MTSTLAELILGGVYAVVIVLFGIFAVVIGHVRRHWDD
jgi:hypothetical protein